MYKILCFGIVHDIVGNDAITIHEKLENVSTLKTYLVQKYPLLKNLSSLLIAVNQVYATDETMIYPNDEIALIPPVSGG